MKRQRRILSKYTLLCSWRNKTPIPSHFPNGWSKGGLDNKNFSNQSPASGTNVKNCTAHVLYQDLANKLISKPSVTSTNWKQRKFAWKKYYPAK